MRSAAKIPFSANTLAVALLLSACSVPATPTDIHDPYEPVNRVTHAANTHLDRIVLRPASQVYGTLLPNPVRGSVDNAARNLSLPAAVMNKAFQGDVEGAVHNFARFAINTTLGVFGLFDPAQDFGLETEEADFGDTLASWGVAEGAYVVLPVLGPSTERAATGRVVDFVTNPLGFIYPSINDDRTAAVLAENINFRYNFADSIDSVLYDSADSYAQTRLIYLDGRRFGQGANTTETAVEELYDDLIFAE